MSGLVAHGLALALTLTAAEGGETGRIVVVAEESLAPFARRVGAELRTRGYEVVYRVRESPAQTLEALRQASASDAALELLDGGMQTRLWFVDRELRRGTERLVQLEAFDERTMALKVAEVLRAHLLVLPAATRAQAQPVEPVAEPPEPGPEPTLAARAGWRVLGAYALGTGLQDTRWASHVRVGGSRRLGRGLHLGLEAQVPVGGGLLEAPEGTTRVKALALGLRLDREWGEGSWRPFVAAGLGAARVRAEGRPSAGFEGAAQTVWSATAELAAGGRLFLTRAWAVEAGVSAGVWLPRTTVRVAGRREAELGAPSALASLGVMYAGW